MPQWRPAGAAAEILAPRQQKRTTLTGAGESRRQELGGLLAAGSRGRQLRGELALRQQPVAHAPRVQRLALQDCMKSKHPNGH